MTGSKFAAALAVSALCLSASAALAAPACPPGVPEGVGCGELSLKPATAGTYALDPAHTSVIAKVPHIGYSYSVFRFGKAEGTLVWDPAAPTKSKLTASVETASIETPVEGFAQQLAGDSFLKSAAFPKATFTSTAFRQTSPTTGQVDGQLTLLGQTRPVTFDVKLMGAGSGYGGKPRLGLEATTALKPQEFGLPPVFDHPIKLVLDVEFERAS